MKYQYQKSRFNSTLVQLKEALNMKNAEKKVSFNSTLVQLKVFVLTLTVLGQMGFNSTLVQLKVNRFRQQPFHDYQFQFYLSLIKSYSIQL